ncbi:hypothetical protein Peur_009836 [Populus x canadensis]
MSRDAMALNPPDFIRGREEEGASSLALGLQARIDETLGEITPRSVLELLALPLSDKYRTRRKEGLQGVRNTLWAVGGGGAAPVAGGLTGEDFMNEAFLCMTAAEQVDLFVTTPSNIPAQNFEVYGVALAPVIAKAFVGKKPHLILDADNLFGQLQQIKDDDDNDLPGLCKLLETWLMGVLFPRFRDTKDIEFKLGDYYDDPIVLRYLERQEGGGRSPLAAAAAIVRIGAEATAVIDHVKASAIQALQKVFPLGHKDMGAEIHENDWINYVHPAVETEEPFESLGLENPEEMFSDECIMYMLKIWADRAAGIAQLGWVYDYTLLDLTVESLTVCVDGFHVVVEAAVKESTRLTDKVHPEKNASNVRNYTTRYELSCAVRDGKLPERQLRCRTCYGLVVILCVFV